MNIEVNYYRHLPSLPTQVSQKIKIYFLKCNFYINKSDHFWPPPPSLCTCKHVLELYFYMNINWNLSIYFFIFQLPSNSILLYLDIEFFFCILVVLEIELYTKCRFIEMDLCTMSLSISFWELSNLCLLHSKPLKNVARKLPQKWQLPLHHILYFHKVHSLNILLICNCLPLKTENTSL